MVKPTLEERLAEVETQEYPKSTVKRVRRLVQYEMKRPGRNKPYRYLETITDFKLYFALHPEWHGKTVSELKDRTIDHGGGAYYSALLALAKEKSKGDKNKQKELVRSILNCERDKRPPVARTTCKELTLEERLAEVRINNPEGYSDDVFERVGKLIENKTPKRTPYAYLEELADYQLYHHLHPEWQGRNITEMQKDKESGALAYYAAFRKWIIRKEKKNKQKQKALMQTIFTPKLSDWQQYTTLEHWTQEFNNHPEWSGRNTREMQKDKESGALAYYAAFKIWAKKEAKGNEQKRQELIQTIFPPVRTDWSGHTTLEDWIQEYEKHPEWQGKSTNEMQKDKESGANAYYKKFVKWARKESKGNEQKRQEIIQTVFSPKQNNWKSNTTLEDWIQEYEKHPEWHGKTVSELKDETKDHGGGAYYTSFNIWARKKAKGNKQKQRLLIQAIFPPVRTDWSGHTTLEDWIQEYEKHPEWQGKSTTEMHDNEEPGASAFYTAFHIWVKREANGDEQRRKELIQTIFPLKRNDWSTYTTLEQWIYEYETHYKGMTRGQLATDVNNGGRNFYHAVQRRGLLDIVFPAHDFKDLARRLADDEDKAFHNYQTLMSALGFNIPEAECFDDYSHICERLNGQASLNLTAFVEDRKHRSAIFVKFYESEELCNKDIYLQNKLASENLASPVHRLDLSRASDDVIDNLTEEHCKRVDKTREATLTEFSRHATVALGREGSKLRCGLYTDKINGMTFTEYLANLPQEDILPAFEMAIEILVDLQNRARALIENDPDSIRHITHKDYMRPGKSMPEVVQFLPQDTQTNSQAHEFNNLIAECVGSELNRFSETDDYVSFVHGDLHPNNMIVEETELENIIEVEHSIFDFERSSIGLQVEDLVRLWHTAKNYGVEAEVKEYFFETAFGPDYDQEECNKMYNLVSAQYWLENAHYYSGRISESETEEDCERYQAKRYEASCEVWTSLSDHMHPDELTKVMTYAFPEFNWRLDDDMINSAPSLQPAATQSRDLPQDMLCAPDTTNDALSQSCLSQA